MEGDTSITVKVSDGKTAGVWTLPKDLLTRASSFFDAALNRPWPESKSKQVELKDDDPAAFRFFVQWLYSWALSKDGNHLGPVSQIDPMIGARAWILGDKLGCPRFQDFALVGMYHYLAARLGTGGLGIIIRAAYANTPPGSRLRRFAAGALLDCVTNRKLVFSKSSGWTDVIDEVEDLSNDMVKLQMLKTKPYVLTENWPDFLLASSYDISKHKKAI